MPSSARTRVAVDATPPRASMPSSGGVASSATTSTRSTDCSPAAFLSTCSGARTIRRARIPRGVSASSPRKTTRASSTPPSAYISSSIPAPATTTDPLASLCALLLTSLAKCLTVALSVLVTRSSSPGSRAGIPTRRALPPPPRAAPPTPTRLVTLANEDVLAVVEDTARTAPRHAITPWDMVSVRRRVCPRRGGAGEEGVVICQKKKTSPSSARHRHRRPGFFSGGASSAFPQSSMGHPRASACFLRRGSGLTTTGCPTFSSSSTSDIESE